MWKVVAANSKPAGHRASSEALLVKAMACTLGCEDWVHTESMALQDRLRPNPTMGRTVQVHQPECKKSGNDLLFPSGAGSFFQVAVSTAHCAHGALCARRRDAALRPRPGQAVPFRFA